MLRTYTKKYETHLSSAGIVFKIGITVLLDCIKLQKCDNISEIPYLAINILHYKYSTPSLNEKKKTENT